MQRVCFVLFVSCLAAACFGEFKPFVAVPGVQEFSGRMIVRPHQMGALLSRNLTVSQALSRRAAARRSAAPSTLHYVSQTDEYILVVPTGSDENRVARALMATGNFQYVEPDWIVYPVIDPNDPRYVNQWHHPKIRSPFAWDLFTGNDSITVAITDTGVRLDHEDLAASLVPGANSTTAPPTPQGSGGLVDDINGHGSHCAGISAARGNNSLGVSGVGWNFKIMPVRVTNSAGGSSSITFLTAGARWAVENGARVISTSYSGVSNAAIQTTGAYIKGLNGIYLYAAGNSNTNLTTFDHLDVTVVGATDSNDAKASFSSYGPGVDVFAPGVGIWSTYNRSATDYASLSGTSLATPCAAGVAAMILATNPILTGQNAETILYQTCFDLGVPGNDGYWGWGRVDVDAAIRSSYANFPFAPLGYTIVNGSAGGGGLPEIRFSDDQRLEVIEQSSSAAEQLPVVLEFESRTTLKTVGNLSFIYEGSASIAGVRQTIALWDYLGSSWVAVDIRTAELSDATATASPSVPGRFVQAGTGSMRARVWYEPLQFDASGWRARVDRVGWRTTP